VKPSIVEKLAAQREATLAQIEALASERAEIASSRELGATDDEHDPEGATIAFEHARVGALLAQAHRHLAAIDHAEARLLAGALDECEGCGNPVGAARREARPTATTCIACASRAT
jgi:DnaK suppressor protein